MKGSVGDTPDGLRPIRVRPRQSGQQDERNRASPSNGAAADEHEDNHKSTPRHSGGLVDVPLTSGNAEPAKTDSKSGSETMSFKIAPPLLTSLFSGSLTGSVSSSLKSTGKWTSLDMRDESLAASGAPDELRIPAVQSGSPGTAEDADTQSGTLYESFTQDRSASPRVPSMAGSSFTDKYGPSAEGFPHVINIPPGGSLQRGQSFLGTATPSSVRAARRRSGSRFLQDAVAAKAALEEQATPTLLECLEMYSGFICITLVCIAANVGLMIAASDGLTPYLMHHMGIVASVNFAVALLSRSSAVFTILCKATVWLFSPYWIPTVIKHTVATSVHHVFGFYMGAGLSGLAWLSYFLVLLFRATQWHLTSDVIAAVIALLIIPCCVWALGLLPLLVRRRSNAFKVLRLQTELLCCVLLWEAVLVARTYNPADNRYALRLRDPQELCTSPEFWISIVASLLLLEPWVTTRRIAVEWLTASGTGVVMMFFSKRLPVPGAVTQITPSLHQCPFHTLPVVVDPLESAKGYPCYVLLSTTSTLFEHFTATGTKLAEEVTIRSRAVPGVPYCLKMFEHVLVVAIGTGICDVLPIFVQAPIKGHHLVWLATEPELNFGEIYQLTRTMPENRISVLDLSMLQSSALVEMMMGRAHRQAVQVVCVSAGPEHRRDGEKLAQQFKGMNIATIKIMRW